MASNIQSIPAMNIPSVTVTDAHYSVSTIDLYPLM